MVKHSESYFGDYGNYKPQQYYGVYFEDVVCEIQRASRSSASSWKVRVNNAIVRVVEEEDGKAHFQAHQMTGHKYFVLNTAYPIDLPVINKHDEQVVHLILQDYAVYNKDESMFHIIFKSNESAAKFVEALTDIQDCGYGDYDYMIPVSVEFHTTAFSGDTEEDNHNTICIAGHCQSCGFYGLPGQVCQMCDSGNFVRFDDDKENKNSSKNCTTSFPSSPLKPPFPKHYS